MLALTRPKFFIPVHGEHRMLVKHAEMAQQLGVKKENTAIVNNGDVIKITSESIKVDGKVTSGISLVDASRTGIVERTVLKERQQLAEDGIITVSATVDTTGKLLGDPTINLRGVVSAHSKEQWERGIIPVVQKSLATRWKEVIDNPDSDRPKVNWDGLRSRLEEDARRYVRRELPKQYPVTVLMLQHVNISSVSTPQDPTSQQGTPKKAKENNKPTLAGRRRRSLSTASAS